MSITKDLVGDAWTSWWKNPAEVELYNFVGKVCFTDLPLFLDLLRRFGIGCLEWSCVDSDSVKAAYNSKAF